MDDMNASVAQLVEHHVANVIVAGSIPVTRSIFFALIPEYAAPDVLQIFPRRCIVSRSDVFFG